MAKKKQTPFSICEINGKDELIIRVDDSGIHPMVVILDSIAIVRFARQRSIYISVNDAIAWHEKELAETNGRSGSQKTLDVLKMAAENFKSGKMVES